MINFTTITAAVCVGIFIYLMTKHIHLENQRNALKKDDFAYYKIGKEKLLGKVISVEDDNVVIINYHSLEPIKTKLKNIYPLKKKHPLTKLVNEQRRFQVTGYKEQENN